MSVLTADEMRAIERDAMDSGQVTGLELMERAGAGVVEAVFEEWPELENGPKKAVIICGPGNNGGDGFVISRLLNDRGWSVEVYLFGKPRKLPPDARANYDRWARLGPVHPFEDGPVLSEGLLVVDAMFGIGQTRPLSNEMEEFAAHAMTITGLTDSRMVAVDVPSGINSDTGEALGGFQFFSELTVTFHAKKPCHLNADALKRCGKVVVKDIGL